MKVYIGYDSRERLAVNVACRSLISRATAGDGVELIDIRRCKARGLFWRPTERRGSQQYDVLSDAPVSTEFAITRFLVPIFQHQGWALWTDCDVVFLEDIAELMKLRDSRKAVQVVKHQHVPTEAVKMDGQAQTSYQRKNWSSVILWNCNHDAHDRLKLSDINSMPGRALHQFYWLEDSEIGELPPEWNWLVGVQPKPEKPAIAHFTLGGPWITGWHGAEHDDIWRNEHARHRTIAA